MQQQVVVGIDLQTCARADHIQALRSGRGDTGQVPHFVTSHDAMLGVMLYLMFPPISNRPATSMSESLTRGC